jgi:hypothetical protein
MTGNVIFSLPEVYLKDGRFRIALFLLCVCMVLSYSPASTYLSTFYSTSKESIIDGRYKVLTIKPAGLCKNVRRVTNVKETRENIKIKELIYIPSLLNKHHADEVSCILDDEHFVSLLAEKGGYVIHALTDLHSNVDQVKALDSIVQWRCSEHKLAARQIALLASELACPRLLTYLSDIALPFKGGEGGAFDSDQRKQRYDIGACVLIQPPPIHALRTEQGRDAILKRYTMLCNDTDPSSEGRQHSLDCINSNVLPILQNIAAGRPGDRDVDVLHEEYLLQQHKVLLSKQVQVQREIEIMEKESDPLYQRKKEARAQRAKKRARRKQLNHIPVTRSGEVITNKVLQQRKPCSVQDLVGYPLSTMKALDVGKIMKDRILMICTDDDSDNNNNNNNGEDGGIIHITNRDENDGADYFFAFPEEDLYAWGRECTRDAARLYNNEPILCLQDLSLEECFDTKRKEDGDDDDDNDNNDDDDSSDECVWNRTMEEKHVKLYSVIYQWLSLLRL